MANINIFTPASNSTLLACTATSATVTIPTGSGTVLRFCNDGSSTVFVNTGSASVAATAGNLPLLANSVELFVFPQDDTTIAAICATGNSTTLRITRGIGI